MSEPRRNVRQSKITPADQVGAARRMPIGALGDRAATSIGARGTPGPGSAPLAGNLKRPSYGRNSAPSANEPPPRESELERRIDAAKRAVYELGYAAGHTRGHADGVDQAHAELAREQQVAEQDAATRAMARMTGVADDFTRDFHEFESRLADQVLELGVALAERVVSTHLSVNPEAIGKVISECLTMMGETTDAITVRAHPDDLAILAQADAAATGNSKPVFIADPGIKPGGCVLESADRVVDAQLPTRWRRALDALGMNDVLATGAS